VSGLILVIEDEADLLESVVYRLQQEGFHTRAALNGTEGLEQAGMKPVPDLVLLDLMLPDMSGMDVFRRLRNHEATRHVPVIIVSARGEEIDRIVGFELGADDYVVKPYSPRELMLRIRAVLRRGSQETARSDEPVTFGCLSLDGLGHRVWVSEQEVALTALEFRLLSTMMERKGRVQTREKLLDDVWGYDVHVTSRTVDTHIKRLREKLGDAGRYIETLRGVGYRFSDKLQEQGA
jgi:two-component system phosphate regulon response regulator PhoB